MPRLASSESLRLNCRGRSATSGMIASCVISTYPWTRVCRQDRYYNISNRFFKFRRRYCSDKTAEKSRRFRRNRIGCTAFLPGRADCSAKRDARSPDPAPRRFGETMQTVHLSIPPFRSGLSTCETVGRGHDPGKTRRTGCSYRHNGANPDIA